MELMEINNKITMLFNKEIYWMVAYSKLSWISIWNNQHQLEIKRNRSSDSIFTGKARNKMF